MPETYVNLNYCQVCGEWLGMDDYDGICCECDDEQESEGTMDALEQSRERIEWMEEWREKANSEEDEDMYAQHRDMLNECRKDATAYAAIAQAEQLARIADILDSVVNGDGSVTTHEMEY